MVRQPRAENRWLAREIEKGKRSTILRRTDIEDGQGSSGHSSGRGKVERFQAGRGFRGLRASLEAKALRYQGLPILSTDRLDIQAEN
jgi:hypothetical protein